MKAQSFDKFSMQTPLDETQAWSQLKNLVVQLKNARLDDLFSQDEKRAERFSATLDDMFLDYSKNLVTTDIMDALKALAVSRGVVPAIKQLLSGAHVNSTEDRAAWHTALRQAHSPEKDEIPEGIKEAILNSRQKMTNWVEQLNKGTTGVTGKTIRYIVHMGIGGSDLGPRLLFDALKPYHQSDLDIRFVANIDPKELLGHLQQIDPEKTLFILASKSFSTQETLENAKLAKAWLQKHLKTTDVSKHFLAVTANVAAAIDWGMLESHILPIWDWVGGRYSVWSSMSLPVALKIGIDHFNAFLNGGYEMDQHFKKAPLLQNIPVILGLLGIWYTNFLKYPTLAILPYDQGLSLLPNYLQQLDMESNGKSMQHSANPTTYATGPIIWGQAGTHGQHAFYQLLHQGTHVVPSDFILVAKSNHEAKSQHDLLLANGLAQSRALMLGDTHEVERHKHVPGNKPSSTLLLRELNPKTLGMLIALYEHKVYVQGVIWHINSFDQPGVELGKRLAKEIASDFEGNGGQTLDPSTHQLLDKIKSYAKNPA